MRTLVIGASGFVGRHLVKYFRGIGTTTSGNDGFLRLDITVPGELDAVIESLNPDIVINSSGMTNVDACELAPELAMKVNGYSIRDLSQACSKIGARLVHISTDYVFNGVKGNYVESDIPDPVNSYGNSKLLGEKYAAVKGNAIVRISTPYGINLNSKKETFSEFVVKKLSTGQSFRAATDLITTPTYVGDISPTVEAIVKEGLEGLIHLGGERKLSRYEFALSIARLGGFNQDLVIPCFSNDLPFKARRPLDTSLNSNYIKKYVKLSELEKSLLYSTSK